MEHEHAASLTARVVKQVLPDRAIVTKDARVMMNTATSMFTLYLTSFAHEASVKQKRGTITLKDVLSALRETEFDHFIEPIEQCLQGTKAADAAKRARKQATKTAAADDHPSAQDAALETTVDGEDNSAPVESDVDMEEDGDVDAVQEEEEEEEEDQAGALTGEESVDEDTAVAPDVEKDAIDEESDDDDDTERPVREEDDLPMDDA
ncbi:hypothetical protein PINS_up001389 [Pythium insidiosum]|nr:hypothetical protein PINS_up001389 [Pythium insidiosum]